jgi:ATP-binding cassette, subfamily B, bacterial
MEIKLFRQRSKYDCGIACLKMISTYYNVAINDYVENVSLNQTLGISIDQLCKIAESLTFKAKAVEISFDSLVATFCSPCIAHINGNHYVIIDKLAGRKSFFRPKNELLHLSIVDPLRGRYRLTEAAFQKIWALHIYESVNTGIIINIIPGAVAKQ